ncbi:sulfotransferase family protein [Sphingomicrobium sediminis]|uniref:Sulfotransferase n=1 Tax=Sphingomicrobium sediminis TaxID=2950949 RepID=A0A9X2J0M9_9SPHN|nr:sulfotransferase [Sphingomicrobium sediminis]MCM8556433.1 sulfotransferase [Sphingomicrobium sediminis]
MATVASDLEQYQPTEEGSLGAARFLDKMLGTLWDKGLTWRPTLDPKDLKHHAMRAEDRAPKEGCWEDRLDILTQALDEEAKLSPLGRAIAHGQLVRKIRCRIRAEAQWARNPAIRDRKVVAPLIIVGQMRSGTTRLHRLLARDPHFVHTRAYETMIPMPGGGRIDKRPVTATANLLFLRTLNPLLAAVHPTGPYQAEEEFGLHAMSIFGAQYEGQWMVPSFARHCETCDRTGVYEEFKAVLQTLGAVRHEPEDKPWVLKAPQFTQDLEVLHEVFPDARYLFLHRDPVSVVGSSASLAWQQARVQSCSADRDAIGAEWLHKTKLRQDRQRAFRQAHPHVPALDIRFDHVNEDWRREIGRVYDFIGRTLDPDVEAAMADFLANSKAHKRHDYDIRDFGLDPQDVASAF